MENLALITVVLASLLPGLLGDANIMKDVTLGFGEAFDHCREESHLTEEHMEEFFHFWRDDFKFNQREFGCALLCMSRYFDLMTDTSRMHHEKVDKFVKSFDNGHVISSTVIGYIHGCEKEFDHMEDHCLRVLRIAECFKDHCKKSGLAPEMELLLAEFIMEADSK